MALAILDGNQSATTLSTIVVSSAHIPAHTVVSLGAQAITDITSAVSSGIVISGAVTIGAGTAQIGSVTASISGTIPVSISSVTIGNSITISSLPSLVAGTAQIGSVTVGNSITIGSIVTHGVTIANTSVTVNGTFYQATQPVSLATLPSLVAGTAQIGSVTASISGTIPVSISSVTIGNSLTIGSIVTHGVTIANTSVTVNGTFYQATQPISISSVTIGNFPTTQPVSIASVTIGNSLTIGSIQNGYIGTVAYVSALGDGDGNILGLDRDFPVNGSVAILAGTAQIGSVTASISNFPASTVVSAYGLGTDGTWRGLEMQAGSNRLRVDAINSQGGSSFPISGSVTLGAGTAQIGSVTASISGTIPVSISSVTIGNFPATQPVSLATLPALIAGTAQIGSVTANLGLMQSVVATEGLTASGTFVKIGGHTGTSTTGNIAHVSAVGAIRVDGSNYTQPISGTVTVGTLPSLASNTDFVLVGEYLAEGMNNYGVIGVQVSNSSLTIGNSVTIGSLPAISGTVTANTFAVQGTAVTTSNFTSITPSTVLASFNATREVLTIFNEGAGNLHICGGATCTTIAYQVRLSAGDYYEVPNHQTTITHSAVFATAGTARVTQVS